MPDNRKMIVNLPELTHSDIVDMIRVLSAFSDAFIAHHQNQLQQQCRSEQPDLFERLEEDQAPF